MYPRRIEVTTGESRATIELDENGEIKRGSVPVVKPNEQDVRLLIATLCEVIGLDPASISEAQTEPLESP